MRSPFGSLLAAASRTQTTSHPPVPLAPAGARRGLSYNLGNGRADAETMMRQYGLSGTLFGIVSLLAESTATTPWHLYRKQPVDGRRRYSTGDQGSDQRVEVIQHAAIQLWNSPNYFHSGFEFREGSQQHEELTGETFWVLDMDAGFPTSMWYVRPDRMEPIPDPDDFLAGWIYTGPSGEQVPLKPDEVILEKRPNPLDPYRGAGPVASIMPNLQQQRYATEYQRNLFLNGADPGGVITVPNNLSDEEFDQVVDRWRDSHRGVGRAGAIGVMEAGMTWEGSKTTNKDMEYGNLRLANRDELREAWRIHKAMMGTSDDVNRANAESAEETFVSWQTVPRLNRRRDTLNSKFLPLFGVTGKGVEFDYDDPSPANAEAAGKELLDKSQAAAALVDAGFDPSDVLEVVGLPDMGVVEKATQVPAAPPGWVPAPPAGAPAVPGAPATDPVADRIPRESIRMLAPRNAAPAPDLAALDAQWKTASQQLADQYQQQVVPAQRQQLAKQARDIAAAGTLALLGMLSLDTSAAAAFLLAGMLAYGRTAAHQAAAEAETSGGGSIAPQPPTSQQLEPIAAAAAGLIAAQLIQAAGSAALVAAQASMATSADAKPDPAAVGAAVPDALAKLSTASAQTRIGGLLSAAQNRARIATFAAGPRCELVASEVLDKATCGPCEQIDGHAFGYSDDPEAVAAAYAAYPMGGYVACLGEDRCRGTLVADYTPANADPSRRRPAPASALSGLLIQMLGDKQGAPAPDHIDLAPLAQFMRSNLTPAVNGHAKAGV